MLNEKFEEALKKVASRLDGRDLNWAVVGSTNMVLQGIDLEPDDLDISTSYEGIKKVQNTFKEYVDKDIKRREASEKGKPDYYEMKLNVEGVEAHVLGGAEDDIYYSKVDSGRAIPVELNGYRVPCLELKAEKEACLGTKREEKAKIIEDFLDDLNFK
ncbi:MAG: nucleotidyltransferase domain-containing protein [Candidatus Aenigmatarchaeota archaeon]